MKGEEELVLYLANKCKLFGSVNTSTGEIAKDINTSQQTVSRKLRELEDKGLITRTVSNEGISIAIDKKGKDALERNYLLLKKIFESPEKNVSGTVIPGLGEGKYYVGIEGYKTQFNEKLGFNPFQGTLNLKIDRVKLNSFLANQKEIYIDGFETKERSFGGIRCYKVKVNGIMAAIIMPERSTLDKGIVEIIAPVKLRDKLKLKENSEIKVTQ